MKKWNKAIAIALGAIAVATALPMGSARALKKLPAMGMSEIEVSLETEIETEMEQEVDTNWETEMESETESKPATEPESNEWKESEAETEIITETRPQEETQPETEFPPFYDEESLEWQTLQVVIGISVKIEDEIQENPTYEANQCVKKAVHTIKLLRNEEILSLIEQFSMAEDIYESISYMICRKTDEGEICLDEGFLEIPNKKNKCSSNQIELSYVQAGDYCIRIKAIWKEEIEVELACHDFTVEKNIQKISLKKDTQTLNYGETVCIDDLLEENIPYLCRKDYEITEISGERNKILEIGENEKGAYLKAVALNGADEGRTTVTIRAKGNAVMEASNVETLTLHIKPIELNMEVRADASSVYLYDTLTIKVVLRKDGEDVAEKLLEADLGLRIGFTITSGESSCEMSSKEAVVQIPVKKEYFKEFYKGATYDITANLEYETKNEYLPYAVNAAAVKVELLGRRAVIKLSAEQDGIYDYRTYYQGKMPVLRAELEDVTAIPDKETNASNQVGELGRKIPDHEAGQILYHVFSENEDVVAVDGRGQYTAADGSIPFSINGVGTATLIVTADASDVYTVESSKINITVKNSPLYDGDFAISVLDGNKSKEQVFCGDENQSGFAKWQEYLNAHNNWINGSVKVSLTALGLKYYDKLKLMKNGYFVESAQQLCLNRDQKISEYTFSAWNSRTRAYTELTEDGKNGVRSFRMGIDTTPPAIKSFSASTNYYKPTSTEEEQYFSQSFVLTGTFSDTISGIGAIEYTTDINAENGAQWMLLEKAENVADEKDFKLVLGDGSYHAIAVRAIDAAGNISEPVCLKNEKGAFIKVIVDSNAPKIHVSAASKGEDDTWQEYSAEGENWTNREIQFQISEEDKAYAGLYMVEYAYQSISKVLCGTPIDDEDWQQLAANEEGIIELSIGGDSENPINKNGCYYFRGVSGAGVISEIIIKKRTRLWQKMAAKKPIAISGVAFEKRYNEWYNKESGVPVIDFMYPEYDTGDSSGEYAAPITIHYNLTVKDEKGAITSLAEDKTATIRADVSKNISPTGFPVLYDDISQLQASLSDDGFYTLEYWITDAAGNKSETEINTYQVDCHEPTGLKVILDGSEQIIGNENTLVYDQFYQNSVSGNATAEYGISQKGSIKLLKAKKIGEWKGASLTENAEQFQVEPNLRCLLYIRAVDGAGNVTEGWTRGIAVDNEAPTGEGTPRLIVEPDGANEHGFFQKDVKVKIDIQDAPNDGNSAGLRLVTASVGTEGANTVSDKELFSSSETQVSEGLMGETEGFCIVETIDAKANEGNHAYITVNATDRSGNVCTDTQELKIDVTKPAIEISFDNENMVNGRYYNADRRAKITITELNFDASLVKINATKNGVDFTPLISGWQEDKANHYVYVDFSEDGDYTLTVACKDLADNEADEERAEPFTIDKTMPKVEIVLESGSVQDGYFNEAQTAVITVTEHNFNENDFHMDIQPGGKIGTWEHKNDTHVIKVGFLSEGKYAVSCGCRDLAGNEIALEDKAKMPLSFVIDTTNPVIEISGVQNDSANAGTVTPSIKIQDTNIEPTNVTISLVTGKGIACDISSDIATAQTDGDFLYTLNGLDAKPDDIYYLTANAVDKAGNESELTYRFSLNRRGSAYDLTDLAKFRDCYYNSYKNMGDIKIVEMNVDKVEEFTMYLSHNADIIYGKSGSRPLLQDENGAREAVLYSVEVSGNEDLGYIYTYTVYRENFAREGIYRLGIYSKDRAGNEVNNLLKQNGEEIQFAIDNTIPRVVIDGVENNEIYDVSSQEVRVAADDNFKLDEAELMLVNKDGEVLESWNYFDLVEKEGDTALITIEERKEEVSLLYRAVDAAGNEVRTLQGEEEAKADFLVTTDKLVQLVKKPAQTPAGRGIVIAFMISLAGIVLIFVLLKKATPNE